MTGRSTLAGDRPTGRQPTMTRFRIERDGDVDLVFEGRQLVEMSTHDPSKPRWAEIRIFATDSGKWVTEMVGRSVAKGERDRITVTVCATPAEVRKGLARTNEAGREYLTITAVDALAEAAKEDPRLMEAAVEEI